ncbi:hypothetical protein IFM89_001798 [Coptis chinensis]|uniref:GATA-type domain-containing protein n=1 Tax=Coptis chinensis TaxID=261450 RepID=A0A835HK82_9MAGN|nr:hypothetical protein IFM89_001798 [Coptis chinensis]
MGKQGPCCHCGVTSTPLWRNGPPEKPVLCNACGSRWRTKGSLVNYFPIQARVFTPPDYEGSRYSRKDKLPPLTKYKNSYIKVHNESKVEDGPSYAAYPSSFEDDASNKSSSGSAISISESCVQFGSTDGNEISGPFESSFYDVQIPSKKRTRVRRCSPPPIENLRQDLRCHSPSPVEKLRQDLVSILQQQDSSYNSEFSEELLLFERDDLSFQSEIGHGSVLLKPQVSSKEEESEASSHRTENKASCIRKTYMGSSYWSLQSQNNQICSLQSVKDDMIQDTGDTNELKENLVKQCFSTNKSLEGAFSGNPDVFTK